ncbi:hypothetical protein ZWY2020_026277 [Hordeum vulgare]|nr:hypothetical protein ZWY2020_026277 [Hordeum vulgare]
MEKDSHKEGEGATAWMTVPAFGDWDMKNDAMPDYSMDFSNIREMRKQNKKELSRASLGGEDDLLAHHKQQQQQPSKPPPPAHGGGRDARNVGGARHRGSSRCGGFCWIG